MRLGRRIVAYKYVYYNWFIAQRLRTNIDRVVGDLDVICTKCFLETSDKKPISAQTFENQTVH